jgi:hypothetical protein
LHIDNSRYDLFVGANMLNHIPFNGNWAEGLEQLVKKLDKDKVPKSTHSVDSSIAN